ncbi:hypothetical protein D3C81_1072210 [compost metagenome]
MDGDQGHHRAAGADIVANVGAQVGDQPVCIGAYHGARQVQAGFFHIGRRTAKLGVVVLRPALLLTGPLHFGTGCRDLADGLIAVGLGALQAAHRHRARVFIDQALEPLGVLPRLALVGLGRHQRRLGRVDASGVGADLPAYRVQVGFGAGQGDAVLLLVQFEQHIALAHFLVIAHCHTLHLPGHLGTHRHHVGLQPGLLGIRRETVGQQVPQQAHGNQQQHPAHAAIGGWRGWRRRSVAHFVSPCACALGAGSSSSSPQSVRCCICWRVAGSIGARLASQPPPRALYNVTRLLTALPRLTR